MNTIKEMQSVCNGVVDEVIRSLVDLYVEENNPGQDEKIKKEIVEDAMSCKELFFEKLSRGFAEILHLLQMPHHWKTHADMKQICEEVVNAGNMIATIEEEKKDMLSILEEKGSIRNILGFSQPTMDRFYECGYIILEKKQYALAVDLFSFLCLLDSKVYAFWYGLGVAQEAEHQIEAALAAFSMASLCDMKNPYAHIQSARCYRLLNDERQSEIALNLALHYASQDEKYHAAKVKATAMLKHKTNKSHQT